MTAPHTALQTAPASTMAASQPLRPRPEEAARLAWVDVAKGLCIILVVMMHSTLGTGEALGGEGFGGGTHHDPVDLRYRATEQAIPYGTAHLVDLHRKRPPCGGLG